ncbi:MAG: DUF3322 domain-containing protein, partial [Candidatus Fibromonas sp.]|nr:DUF3322 domain-containing protein [Candidatus Fibromonas sp.]
MKYQTTKKKEHGIQDMPVKLYFQTEVDFLKYLHKEREVAEFRADCSLIISKYPELKEWIIK